MDLDEARAIRDLEREERAEVAGQAVLAMCLPNEIDLPQEINNLGAKLGALYKKVREGLYVDLGPRLARLVALALHEYWFACWEGAAFFIANIEDGSFNDNEYTRNLSTPAGYADQHGWANTLANGFADIVPAAGRVRWIKELTGLELETPAVMFKCIALYWLHRASLEAEHGNNASMLDLVHEAHEALAVYYSDMTWDYAWTDAMENAQENLGPKVRSELARKAGRAAHAENHALKAEVREFWKNNIPTSLSNDASATILMRQFPLKFRTLSRYVSEFKNND